MSQLLVEIPTTLHRQLELQARYEGVPLSHYIVYALARQAVAAYTVHALPENEVDQQRAQFDALLESLGPPASDVQAFLAQREVVEPEPGLTSDVIERVRQRIAQNKS